MTYHAYTITILPRAAFAARTWYFYRISGNGLPVPVETDMGEATEQLAIDAAKMFVDEHLVREVRI